MVKYPEITNKGDSNYYPRLKGDKKVSYYQDRVRPETVGAVSVRDTVLASLYP